MSDKDSDDIVQKFYILSIITIILSVIVVTALFLWIYDRRKRRQKRSKSLNNEISGSNNNILTQSVDEIALQPSKERKFRMDLPKDNDLSKECNLLFNCL